MQRFITRLAFIFRIHAAFHIFRVLTLFCLRYVC